MSKTSIEMVKEFHETFNHPVGTEPAMPGVERQEFRATFMKEEINEGLDAKDIVELADSLGDQQYVLDGWFLEAGLHPYKDAIMAEIQRSNMSKACISIEEAEQTIDKLTTDNLEYSYHYDKVGDKYIVYRNDGKIMKSINYSPVDLHSIIFPKQ